MQTYWDHKEQERAAMTREEVERFLDAELMTKGVLKVAPPILDEVPEVPKAPITTFYRLSREGSSHLWGAYRDLASYAFATIGDAEKFVAMKVQEIKESGGITYVEPLAKLAIGPVECVTTQDYLNIKSANDAAQAIRESNNQAEAKYTEASKKTQECLQGVWQDWAECREAQAAHQKVLDTLEEYKKMAGDEETAVKFLRKAFTNEEITKAFAWFNREVPELPMAEFLGVD